MSKVKESFADHLNFALGEFARQASFPKDLSCPQSATPPAPAATFDKLLAFARSARNAFEERLSFLTDERVALADITGDEECCWDLDAQIGNYEALVERADAVIAEAEGR